MTDNINPPESNVVTLPSVTIAATLLATPASATPATPPASASKKHRPGRFQPGKSGNPGGRPIQLKAIVELARSHSAASIATLVAIRDDAKQPGIVRVRSAEVLLDRAWGKTANIIALDTDGGAATSARAQRDELRDMILASVAGMASATRVIEKLGSDGRSLTANNVMSSVNAPQIIENVPLMETTEKNARED